MKNEISIEEYCDGFAVVVNGQRYIFDQEDSIRHLQEIFLKVDPEAKVTFEECY